MSKMIKDIREEPITMAKLGQFVEDCKRFLGKEPKMMRFNREDFKKYIEMISLPDNEKTQIPKSVLNKMKKRKTFFFRGIKIRLCQKK